MIIIVLGIYLIHHNYQSYYYHFQTMKLMDEYYLNAKINAQLHLKVTHSKSNIHVKKMGIETLEMSPPKRIRTLD